MQSIQKSVNLKNPNSDHIPELRFPEFDGEWENKKLGEIAVFINGKAYKQTELLDSGKYPVLRVGNFFSNSSWYHSNLELAEDKYCENGDLLYAWSASFGPKIWDGKKTIYHYHIWKVVNKINLDKKYLFYLLDEQTLRMKTNSSNGFALLHITKGTIENWDVIIPNRQKEQQKIASFFTAIDKRIQLLQQKQSKLESYKKGIMQKLFSQELRFKDEQGNEFADWEEKKLGDIVSITTGKLDANAMKINGIYRFYTCAKEHYQINEFAFDTEALLISGNGANVGYIHYYKGKFNAYQRTYVLYNLSQSYLFIKYYLDKFLGARISKEKKDGNTPYIVMGTLTEMEIQLPNNEEQEKIASFLSAIDEGIEKVGQQVAQMQGYKKGLLQGMFV